MITESHNILSMHFLQLSVQGIVTVLDELPYFELQQVPSTNIYLGIKKKNDISGFATCQCNTSPQVKA